MLAIFIIAFLLVILLFLAKLSLQLMHMEKRLGLITDKLEKEISEVFGTFVPGGSKEEESE